MRGFGPLFYCIARIAKETRDIMSDTKRAVWEAAKDAGLDDMISAVSRVFGKDAISDICISGRGIGIVTTNDDLAIERTRIKPGFKANKNDSAKAAKALQNVNPKRLKG